MSPTHMLPVLADADADLRQALGPVLLVDAAHRIGHLHGRLDGQVRMLGVSTGAPQKAITQSPMYLSIVPRLARIRPSAG
jgi:hypothetical protein